MAMSRSFGGMSFTTRSPIVIVPSETSSRPAIIRSVVDFPHPDGPTSTTNSLSFTSRLTPCTATNPPSYTFFTLFNITRATMNSFSLLKTPDAVPESGERNGSDLRVGYCHSPVEGHSGDGECHRYPMVSRRFHDRGKDGLFRFKCKPVRVFLNRHAHLAKIPHDRGNPVRFLVPKLSRAPHFKRASGYCQGRRKNGDFINHERYRGGIDSHLSLEMRKGSGNRSIRFSRYFLHSLNAHLRADRSKQVQSSCSGRVESGISYEDFGFGNEERCTNKEHGRRNITGDAILPGRNRHSASDAD